MTAIQLTRTDIKRYLAFLLDNDNWYDRSEDMYAKYQIWIEKELSFLRDGNPKSSETEIKALFKSNKLQSYPSKKFSGLLLANGKSLLPDSVIKQITSRVDAGPAKPIDVGIVISLAFIVLNKKMTERLKQSSDTEFYQEQVEYIFKNIINLKPKIMPTLETSKIIIEQLSRFTSATLDLWMGKNSEYKDSKTASSLDQAAFRIDIIHQVQVIFVQLFPGMLFDNTKYDQYLSGDSVSAKATLLSINTNGSLSGSINLVHTNTFDIKELKRKLVYDNDSCREYHDIYAGILEFITEIMDEFYNSNSSKPIISHYKNDQGNPIEISSTTNLSELYDAILNSNDVTITKLI